MRRSKLGIHSLVWTGDWSAEAARRACERTRQAGFDLIEIGCLDSWRIDIESTRRLLAEHGLGVLGSLGLGADTDITSADPDRVAAGERLLRNALRVVRDLGGDMLTGITYARLGKYEQPPTEAGWAQSVEVMQRVADEASGMGGMRIGIEVVNRYDSNLINTTSQALRYLDDVGRDNVLVHLDTYHMNMEESDLMSPVLQCAERLGYVHVSESHRGYLGSGTIDLHGFFKALTTAGYTGPVTFESFSSAVVEPALSNALGIWRNVWEDSDHLAAHARSYLESMLVAAERSGA
jgi:D-psicose/D-tagatose/L-ribulose 3-epimerase